MAVMVVGVIPICLFALVVGGNVGLMLGPRAFAPMIGEPIGMALGIGVVFSVCLAGWGVIGVGLGSALAWIVGDRPSAATSGRVTERGEGEGEVAPV